MSPPSGTARIRLVISSEEGSSMFIEKASRFPLVHGLLLVAVAGTLAAQNPAVTISIDASANRHPINPNIYGVAYGDSSTLSQLNVPLNRLGGNNTTRYNWQLNADNRAADWFFESIGYSSAVAGEGADTFISNTKTASAESMITIPMIGWVAKLGSNRGKLASFSQAKYGAQTGNDWQWFPDAGNGILASSGQPITGNDPNDADVPADSSFQQAWVEHMVGKWGPANAGGLRYYILDNEHSIWHSTHADVHPNGATMDEIKAKILDYAAKIKAVDPAALVVGPEEWGWSGYLLSGYDQQYGSLHGWSVMPDRNNHGGMDYLPWLLSQLKQTSVAGGLRPLDVFSVHYYPQGGEFGNDTSTAMQLRRNRSTRSLWDPSYVDETWIATQVKLIPRLRGWVDTYYFPGTPIGITEYNWGAEGHINGATTQADILGIFGREGLDLGTRWTTPDPSTPTFRAIQMYRNYDGSKSTFGDTGVSATVPNPDNVSAFAAVRSSDGALTVIVVGKYLAGSTPATLNLSQFTAGTAAHVWQLTAANTIQHLPDVPISNGAITAQLPQQSITLFVIPAGNGNQPPTAIATATPSSGTAPLAVAFDGTKSKDPDGTITAFAWTFGDGSSASSSTVNHTYTQPGTFNATLTVTDNGGAQSTARTTITVQSASPSVFEVENLAVQSISSGVTQQIQSDPKLSGGKGVWVNTTAAGQFVAYRVSVPEARTYQIKVRYKRNTNRGIWQLSADGTNVGSPRDEYGSVSYLEVVAGNVTFASAGSHTLRFTVTGKRAASAAYTLVFDRITLIPQ
jgi:PKD repeat protein